jgi:hypothetical protein
VTRWEYPAPPESWRSPGRWNVAPPRPDTPLWAYVDGYDSPVPAFVQQRAMDPLDHAPWRDDLRFAITRDETFWVTLVDLPEPTEAQRFLWALSGRGGPGWVTAAIRGFLDPKGRWEVEATDRRLTFDRYAELEQDAVPPAWRSLRHVTFRMTGPDPQYTVRDLRHSRPRLLV